MSTVTRGKILRSDLANWDGKTATATRPDATGGTITGLAIGNAVDVLQVFGDGDTGNMSAGTIQNAIQVIGSTEVGLIFTPGTWTISSNLTIPENFTCYIPHGCTFDIDSGVTLTFDGGFYAGMHQIFSGDGSAVLTRNWEVHSTWWGAKGGSVDDLTALQAAIDSCEASEGGRILLLREHSISGELTMDNHGVWLEGVSGSRGTSTNSGTRIYYTGSGTNAITVDGVNGGGIRNVRLENTGTGSVGFNFVDSQNFIGESFHVREFTADNWLFGCTTAVSCIYNTFTNCSGWTAGASANGIRMYEGSGKATNNNVWYNSNFGNNAVGIHQDDECHDNSFLICELGSCTKGAELRGRTHMVANVESCTTGLELVSGSAASVFGYLHFASNGTDISNSGNLSVFAAMHGGDSGSPLHISASNCGMGLRGATPPTVGGINLPTNDGNPVLQRAGDTAIIFEDGVVRINEGLEIDGNLNHDGTQVGFYGAAPINQQTGVAVSAAGVHAALVNLGLITA